MSAVRRFSGLFVAKGVDGIELGGFTGWVETEKDADGAADGEGEDDGVGGDYGLKVRDFADGVGGAHAAEDAEDAAEQAEGDGLDEELQEDGTALGADGHADTDFPCSFGDADQHDVHDADATDEEGHTGDGAEHEGDDAGDTGDFFCDFLLVEDVEVIWVSGGSAVALAQERADLRLGRFHAVGAGDFDVEQLDGFLTGQAFHDGGIREDESVVLVVAAETRSLAAELAGDDERDVVNANGLADGIDGTKEFVGGFAADDGDFGGAAYVAFGEHGASGYGPVAD